MSNQETLDLCSKMGIGVKTQSSTIIDQQADRVRTKAQREGLVRDVQPEEPKPVKKAVKKAAAKNLMMEPKRRHRSRRLLLKKQLRKRQLLKKQLPRSLLLTQIRLTRASQNQ